MSTRSAITTTAADKKAGLTLAELGQAVQEAHRADLAGNAKVTVRIGWSSQIQSITIEGVN